VRPLITALVADLLAWYQRLAAPPATNPTTSAAHPHRRPPPSRCSWEDHPSTYRTAGLRWGGGGRHFKFDETRDDLPDRVVRPLISYQPSSARALSHQRSVHQRSPRRDSSITPSGHFRHSKASDASGASQKGISHSRPVAPPRPPLDHPPGGAPRRGRIRSNPVGCPSRATNLPPIRLKPSRLIPNRRTAVHLGYGACPTGPEAALMWPHELFYELFQGSNGWSIRDYWLRASLGLLQFEFDFSISNWWHLDKSHAELRHDRAGTLAACRRLVEGNGNSLAAFNGVIAFVHAPPSDVGALGTSGAVLDQDGTIPFFQHEMGRVLGFKHSFGPFIPPPKSPYGSEYNDPYCVMGYTSRQAPAHRIPAPPNLTASADILLRCFLLVE
jgi:hypothetical protein